MISRIVLPFNIGNRDADDDRLREINFYTQFKNIHNEEIWVFCTSSNLETYIHIAFRYNNDIKVSHTFNTLLK